MKLSRLAPRSLYVRIACVYLVLLLALSVISAVVATHSFQSFTMELAQKLNRDVATTIATQLEPGLSQQPAAPILRRAVHRIHMVNPSLDLLVLNTQGRVLASSLKGAPAQKQVSLAPIRAFLDHQHPLPIRGDDPFDPKNKKAFSVAPITLQGGTPGYLYVVLQGMDYQSAAGMIKDSYILHALALTLLIALAFTGVIGLVLFAFITRRFRRLAGTVAAFKDGAYERRVGDRSNDEIGRLGVVFDDMAATISAQVEALKETDARRRRLVANLSHDLRTPLTSLLGYAQHLQEHAKATAEERRRHLEAIVTDGHQLTRLVEQLASLSRLDAHQDKPALEAFAPQELAQDLILKFQPRAAQLGITLEDGFEHNFPPVLADIGLIERALANLVDNALAHTPRGGRVALSLSAEENGVCFCVSDTGSGIPANEVALVTQRFYRTRASREQHPRGSGLGLAIVKEITDAHGARLRLSSGPGGTRACFTLANAPHRKTQLPIRGN